MIKLPVPPSTNALYETGRKKDGTPYRRRSDAYEAWITMAGYQLNLQRPQPIIGKAKIEIACPRNGRRDLGNHEKAISDLLVKHGVLRDDRYIEQITMRWHDDAEHNGYCLIELGRFS